jgi:gliding motility-associated-like protein
MPDSIRKSFLLFSILILASWHVRSQTYVFAQLAGSPVDTTGWNMTGSAALGNVTGTGNSEVRLTGNVTQTNGSIYFRRLLNANLCNKWIVEFDFRIFDGTAADGLAFWYLDVPPIGFVNGSGLGIPATANGLKVGFDTYNNCGAATTQDMPKIEIRWGVGYSECWAQPTAPNAFNILSFIRSNNYSRARIVYNNGAIQVFVNNTLYLSGNYALNFPGYLGFSASTGDQYDNQSIKNVIIYTDIPPSLAGSDTVMCNNSTIPIGLPPSGSSFLYSWSPATGLSDATVSNPTLTLSNNLTVPVTRQYILSTSLVGSATCASKDTLLVTVLPDIRSTENKTVCFGQSYLGYSVSGTYTDTLVSYRGCDSIHTLNLTVNPILSSTVNQNICYGQSFEGYTVSGTYVDTLITADGCDSVRTINLTVAPILSSSLSQTICEGQSFMGYSASGTYSDTLVTPGGCDSLVILNLTVNPRKYSVIDQSICQGQTYLGYSSTGTYIDTLVATSGCDSIRTLNLRVNSSVFSNIEKRICQGESYLGYTATGLYTDTLVAAGGCDSIRILSLTVEPNPEAQFSFQPASGCAPLDVQFTNTSTNITRVNYTWNFGEPGTGGQPTTNHIYLNPGSYTVSLTATSDSGCTTTTTLSNAITVFTQPNASFTYSPNPNTFGNSQIQFINNSTSASVYQWSFGDGVGSSSATSPSYSYTQPGTYTVRLTAESGNDCVDSASAEIIIYALEGLYIPNAFSPNEDGLNETFGVLGLGISNVEMTIYNRYGSVIFRSSSSNPKWNGRLNGTGKKCDEGNYVYLIRLTDAAGGIRTLKGNILLIR